MKELKRLEAMISRAYALALQAQEGTVDPSLAEEVSGECAEFLALLNNDMGAFGDDESMDPDLVALVNHLTGEVQS